MYMYMYMYVCVFVSISIYIYICICIVQAFKFTDEGRDAASEGEQGTKDECAEGKGQEVRRREQQGVRRHGEWW